MDKYSGGLALGAHGHGAGVDLMSAMSSAVVGDVLQAVDDSGSVIHLEVTQDPGSGGLCLVQVADPSAAQSSAIARSQMHSMLADSARCKKYAAAIARVVRPGAHVLDIGAGTGLLALLSARAGAEHVAAAEMFAPLAQLATDIVAENGMTGTVTMHAVPSTTLTVGEGDNSLPRKVDVLVSEILDSALLGEAVVPAFAHAHKHLLAPGAAVIPARARLFAQVVSSPLFRSFHDLGADFPFHRSKSGSACGGGQVGTPVHLGALEGSYTAITDPFLAFTFSFGSEITDLPERRASFSPPRTSPGRADAVVTWWELDLTADGVVQYSTAPSAEPWQDHWLQVVYPLSGDDADKEETVTLAGGHNDARFWFSRDAAARDARACACGFRALPGGAGRIAELGDLEYHAFLRGNIKKALAGAAGAVLDLSDGSVCGLQAAAEDADRNVVSVETDPLSARLYEQASVHAGTTVQFVGDLGELGEDGSSSQFGVVLAEPFFHATLNRPAETLAALLATVRALRAQGWLTDDASCVPAVAEIVATPIRFVPGEDPFVRAPAIVSGVKHDAFHRLCPLAPRMYLPLYMHRCKKGEETVLATADVALAHELEVDASVVVVVPDGEGRAAIAVEVRYDGRRPHRTSHSFVIPLEETAASGGKVLLRTVWDVESAEWNFVLQ